MASSSGMLFSIKKSFNSETFIFPEQLALTINDNKEESETKRNNVCHSNKILIIIRIEIVYEKNLKHLNFLFKTKTAVVNENHKNPLF